MSDAKEVFPFLVTVFPGNLSKQDLLKMSVKLVRELESATGNAPHIVHPNITTIMFLVEGQLRHIAAKVQDACDNETHWLIARIESPYTVFGLANSSAWIQSALRRTEK